MENKHKPTLMDAFYEASLRVQAAAICFILAKFMFVSSAFAMLASKILTIITLSLYSGLIFTSVILCLLELVQRGKDDEHFRRGQYRNYLEEGSFGRLPEQEDGITADIHSR